MLRFADRCFYKVSHSCTQTCTAALVRAARNKQLDVKIIYTAHPLPSTPPAGLVELYVVREVLPHVELRRARLALRVRLL